MTDRTQGILNRASDAPKFSGVRWILGDGVLTNYMQSYVDDTMKRNAEFQSKAGVSPKIVRKSPTKCCPWCDALVGEYKYPDDVPDDVYRRHDNCNCIVEFYPGDGRKQDVWSKQWSDEPKEVLKERKTAGLPSRDKEPAKQMLKDMGFEVVSPTLDVIPTKLLNANAEQLKKLEDKFGIIKRSENTVVQQKSKKGAVAFVTRRVGNSKNQQLSFGASYKNEKKLIASQRESINDGWSMPAPTDDATMKVYSVTHEYGHMVENVLAAESNTSFDNYTRKAWSDIIEIAKSKNPDFDLSKSISIYGRTNVREAFAECFANSQLGTPNELGDAMNIWLERNGL